MVHRLLIKKMVKNAKNVKISSYIYKYKFLFEVDFHSICVYLNKSYTNIPPEK